MEYISKMIAWLIRYAEIQEDKDKLRKISDFCVH